MSNNAIAARDDTTLMPAPDRTTLVEVLGSSLYPGAKPVSIELVLDYCAATKLDPMQKPVHIVPMRVKVPGTRNDYEWRDVLMPGIGLYRVQAARTGQYAGCTEPEFGPTLDLTLGDVTLAVPEWCRVTVRRLVAGVVAEFSAREFWLENYATAGKDTAAPNAMWTKRPFGQLAKCAEAQALRKAFPEVGSQPTAEEMEGKPYLDDGMTLQAEPPREPLQRPRAVTHQRAETPPPQQPARQPEPAAQPRQQQARNESEAPRSSTPPARGSANGGAACSAGQAKMMFARCKGNDIPKSEFCERFGIAEFDDLPKSRVDEALAWIADYGASAGDEPPREGELVDDDFDPNSVPF